MVSTIPNFVQEDLLDVASLLSTQTDQVETEYTLFYNGEKTICDYADSCDPSTLPELKFDPIYMTFVTEEAISFYTPPERNVEDRDSSICALNTLYGEWLEQTLEFIRSNFHIAWRYAGAISLYANFPGVDQGTVELGGHNRTTEECSWTYLWYLRPWFTSCALGPTDTSIIVDRSGSMTQGGRLDIARNTLIAVIESMSHVSYFTITLFAGNAITSPTYRGTRDQKDMAISWVIEYMNPIYGTNFDIALNQAFDALDEARRNGLTSGCRSKMIFITDGEDVSGVDILALLQNRNSGDSASQLDTIAISTDHTELLKKMSCQNRGTFYNLDQPSRLLNVIMDIIKFDATFTFNDGERWSEVYEDAFGTGPLLSICKPYYNRQEDPPIFEGVLAMDISVQNITDTTHEELSEWARTRSKHCSTFHPTDDQIEELRPNNAKCYPPIEEDDSDSADAWVIIIIVLVCSVIIIGISILFWYRIPQRLIDNIPVKEKNIEQCKLSAGSTDIEKEQQIYPPNYPPPPYTPYSDYTVPSAPTAPTAPVQ